MIVQKNASKYEKQLVIGMSVLQAKPIVKVALNQHVVNAVIDSIRSGELHLGDKLPSENQLCQKFNVGRHVIREALRRLEELAIVRTEPGLGTFVCTEAPDTLGSQVTSLLLLGSVDSKDLFEFRIAIETYAARFAAIRATEENLAVMSECLVIMLAYKDSENQEFLDANFRFHNEVIKASGNQMYIVLYNTMNAMLAELIKTAPYSNDSKNYSLESHKSIFEAIKSRNPEKASQLALDHLLDLRKRRFDDDAQAFADIVGCKNN